jgi:hypothetical protein
MILQKLHMHVISPYNRKVCAFTVKPLWLYKNCCDTKHVISLYSRKQNGKWHSCIDIATLDSQPVLYFLFPVSTVNIFRISDQTNFQVIFNGTLSFERNSHDVGQGVEFY